MQPLSSDRPASRVGDSPRFDAIGRIPVDVQVVIGTTTMAVADIMALNRGAVVALDRRIGEPVDIVVNGRVVARGDLQVLDDDAGRFGIVVKELVGLAADANATHGF